MAASPPPRAGTRRRGGAGLKPIALLFAVVAVAATVATCARADGDPASDVLYTRWVFQPLATTAPAAEVRRLNTVVQTARADGYPIKVAIIAEPADLGTAYVLWGKPKEYARFLGSELTFLYRGRLLVVMPRGFGLFRYRKPVPEGSVLESTAVAPGPNGLIDSAVTAVARLARAAGHPIPVPPPVHEKAKGSSSHLMDRLIIVLAALLVVIAFFAPTAWRRLMRPSTHTGRS